MRYYTGDCCTAVYDDEESMERRDVDEMELTTSRLYTNGPIHSVAITRWTVLSLTKLNGDGGLFCQWLSTTTHAGTICVIQAMVPEQAMNYRTNGTNFVCATKCNLHIFSFGRRKCTHDMNDEHSRHNRHVGQSHIDTACTFGGRCARSTWLPLPLFLGLLCEARRFSDDRASNRILRTCGSSGITNQPLMAGD